MNQLELMIQFLFPVECKECGREDILSRYTGICKNCYRSHHSIFFPNQDPNRCEKCKNPLGENRNCSYCNSRNVFLDKTWVMRPKGSKERKLMNELKFRNERVLSRFFSLGINKVINELRDLKPEAIVPIPSHLTSKQERPFLSTESLLRRLSGKLDIPVLNCLDKISKTKQSSLTRMERFIHAKTAFRIKKKCLHQLPESILLVDDVFTTGASTNEVACLLKSAGVTRVFQLILLRPIEGIEL